MNNNADNKAEEAMREYLEAVDNHDSLLDRYFPVRPVVPGKPIITGETITKEVLEEIKAAENNITKTRERWDRLLGI